MEDCLLEARELGKSAGGQPIYFLAGVACGLAGIPASGNQESVEKF